MSTTAVTIDKKAQSISFKVNGQAAAVKALLSLEEPIARDWLSMQATISSQMDMEATRILVMLGMGKTVSILRLQASLNMVSSLIRMVLHSLINSKIRLAQAEAFSGYRL